MTEQRILKGNGDFTFGDVQAGLLSVRQEEDTGDRLFAYLGISDHEEPLKVYEGDCIDLGGSYWHVLSLRSGKDARVVIESRERCP